MSDHRQLDDGDSDVNVYDYYAEPPDTVKPEGKTILLLAIFGILVAISVGYFILNLLFPGIIDKVEGRVGSTDEEDDNIDTPSISYQPPRPSGGEIALV